jgi:hypothetical protein
MPAPVFSRSSFTSAAVILAMAFPLPAFPEAAGLPSFGSTR